LVAAIAKVGGTEPSAAPGTILLTRIDELAADLQAELALWFGRRPPSVRLLATAGRPLAELARCGEFREDLAALFGTLVIELPPLMKRREDLPVLAQLFLEESNAHGARQLGGFTPAAIDALDAYPWPGNLDELAEVVAVAHRRATGAEIDAKDLPDKLHWVAQAAAHPRRVEEKIVLDEYLRKIERELIERALHRSKQNKTKAARLLGMTRPRLYRRMWQLGLEPAPPEQKNRPEDIGQPTGDDGTPTG
jgi:DNA-binding NtrC family response regulator